MTMSRVNLMKSIVTNFIVQTKERHKISIEFVSLLDVFQ